MLNNEIEYYKTVILKYDKSYENLINDIKLMFHDFYDGLYEEAKKRKDLRYLLGSKTLQSLDDIKQIATLFDNFNKNNYEHKNVNTKNTEANIVNNSNLNELHQYIYNI